MRSLFLVLSLGFISNSCCLGQEALFIGNSYTYGGSDKPVSNHGGVPKVVELVAASKGKALKATMLAVGGKDWGFHLQQSATDQILRRTNWDFVVLQDFSLATTHQGNPRAFLRNGQTFYRRIRQVAPKATIMLYETWARAPGNGVYRGTNSPPAFRDPASMDREIQGNYERLARRLEVLEPGTQVALAPVGPAFARCRSQYPEIQIYSDDKHHANSLGSYLAALVIYSAMFHDSPIGATADLFGMKVDAAVAEKLQGIAQSVVPAILPGHNGARALLSPKARNRG